MKHAKSIVCLAFVFLFSSCQGQIKKDKEELSNEINPQTTISVNKEYDKNGNLIRYDSTYAMYYSSIQDDSIRGDSIYQNFRDYFNQRYFFSESPFFSEYFFLDSMLHDGFYTNDFFSNRFLNDMERMNNIFRGMDSIKNRFFEQQFDDKKW